MSGNAVALAKASYQRCLNAQDFFPTFYQTFFDACPPARPMFAGTDMQRQHKLLQHAIGLLLSFNTQKQSDPNLLTRVADRHGRNDLKVDASHYQAFVDSLIGTARKFDPEFSAETEEAWRTATEAGIAYMKSKS